MISLIFFYGCRDGGAVPLVVANKLGEPEVEDAKTIMITALAACFSTAPAQL